MLTHGRSADCLPTCSPYYTSSVPRSPARSPCAQAVRQQRRGIVAHAQTTQQNKEFRPPRWDYVYANLTHQRDLETLSAKQAWDQMQKGKLQLIDVRPKARFEEAHPPGAKSAQLYRKTDFSQFSFQRYFKAAALMANGIEPVEPNPNFMSELTAAAGGKPVCMMCETGGTLSASTNFPTGKVSRSLLAAFQAFERGKFPGIYHLKGGAMGWSKSGMPFEGEYSGAGAGRTPNVVAEEEEDAVSTIREVQSDK